jgi:ribonuclease HI
MIEISTDGSVGTKTGDGGWAFVVEDERAGTSEVYYGWEANTTISRMELLACIKAFEWSLRTYTKTQDIRLTTDSSYVRNCFKDKWYRKWERNGWLNSKDEPVANKDLWIRLLELNKAFKVHWVHVKGHQGRHAGNEDADRWAVYARKERANGKA